MSSLIFYIDETQALVATDTLATLVDGTPLKFASKTYIVPHLRMIMTGVGTAAFLSRWFVFINDRFIVRGIQNLDYHTPSALRTLWQEHKKELSIPDHITTTVYHFGYTEDTHVIHAYAYRSTNNFESELLKPYGLRGKPEFKLPKEYTLPQDISKFMLEQREIQLSKPKQERIYIGGEIELFHLTKDGFRVSTYYKFDDFDQQEAVMFENCSKN